jgi:DDE family transposase
MSVHSTTPAFHFQTPSALPIHAAFDGGHISSDAGALLLAQVDRHTGLLARLAACFTDYRAPDAIEHTLAHLVAQRVYAVALGYEDLNDHDRLRFDPLLATLVGKDDPQGLDRLRPSDRGKPLAGKSTLNRLELTPPDAGPQARYKKIVADPAAIEQLFLDLFLEAHPTPPEEIVLDLDATDDPLHGMQEGRFFHGYYDCYCYLPLYLFCGEHLLAAKLRTAEHGAASGALDELRRVVEYIRRVWPEVRILVRGDSDFATEEIMAWCEGNGVDYVFGLGGNSRLLELIGREMMWAHVGWLRTGVASRQWADFDYQTRTSWSRARRVVAKAEHLPGGPNPRFVVTSLSAAWQGARELYEQTYCGRGEAENRLKEQKLDLASGRTSTRALRSNQLRLWWSAAAYVLVSGLRRLGLAGTALARGQCGSLRQRLLKIGAWVQVSAERVRVSLSEAFALREVFARAYAALSRLGAWPGLGGGAVAAATP